MVSLEAEKYRLDMKTISKYDTCLEDWLSQRSVSLATDHEYKRHTLLAYAKDYVGWKETAGGVGVAWDKIRENGLLPEYDVLNLTWVMGECIESRDAGAVIEWIESAAIISGTVGKFYNFPLMVWAPMFSSALLNTYEYPTVISSTFSSINQAQTLLHIFQHYEWTEIGLIYYISRSNLLPRCSLVMADLETLMNGYMNMTITYRRQVLNYNNDTFKNALQGLKGVTRVTVACFETDDARRNFMVAIAESGMDTDEYMWIMIESRKAGFG
ncbi:hypothetical protein OESDEN_11116 [Oesophagostomum dentatum]|uniref:Receptor ligand binding region domain-containing protein n=1 Tax=Oesophagostomum dentatum TaxID=61180 RepID=A0A0B1SZZ1_OESDE|nr:hypothetical protein OESDEN_11116 [Oesophagostomum dentatum]